MIYFETFVGAVFPLTHPGHYFHWHFINVSYSNIVVIVLMVVAFVAALVAPFPGRGRRGGHR